MSPYKHKVGELYRTLDCLRDSILNENREEFGLAVKGVRDQLTALEALIPPGFDLRLKQSSALGAH